MEARLGIPRPVRSQPEEVYVRHAGAVLGPVHCGGLQEVAAVVQGRHPQAQLHRQVRLWDECHRDEGGLVNPFADRQEAGSSESSLLL